jgi:hypothetical protein
MPYEVRAKAGESAFSVVVETAREALKKIDELLDLGHRAGSAKSRRVC